jgi:hypothetical protein
MPCADTHTPPLRRTAQDGDPSKPKVKVPEGYSYEIYNRDDIERIMARLRSACDARGATLRVPARARARAARACPALDTHTPRRRAPRAQRSGAAAALRFTRQLDP